METVLDLESHTMVAEEQFPHLEEAVMLEYIV